MSTENNTPQPQDEASQWYADLRTGNIRNIDARLEELAGGHSALENQFRELCNQEESAHDIGDTREIVRALTERQRIQNEAAQITNAYSTLQSERQRLEQHADPRFEELIANSSAPSQMFLRVHRHKLENDPAALKQLMFADARAKAAGLKPDSNHYFRSLEAAVGLDASDRNLDDFNELSDEQRAAKNSAKRTKEPEFKPTPEQLQMSKDLHGIDSADYLKACARPFSQASEAVQHVEPASFDTNQHKSMEVTFEPEPAKKTVSKDYKPGPSAITLNPAEVELCKHMAVNTNRPEKDVLKEFAANKIALHSGKSGHYQLYDAKLRAEGNR